MGAYSTNNSPGGQKLMPTLKQYTRQEQVLLTSFWYCMQGVQLMVGSVPNTPCLS